MSLTSKQRRILKKFFRGANPDLVFKNFSFQKISIKKRKVLSGFGSVFTQEERGIFYYNDYVEIPVVGLSTEAIYHTSFDYSAIAQPLITRLYKQAILDALTALFMSSLKNKRGEDVARKFGFSKKDFLIPNGYEVHQYFDETEYGCKVKNYQISRNSCLSLEVCFWVKTYPLLAKK